MTPGERIWTSYGLQTEQSSLAVAAQAVCPGPPRAPFVGVQDSTPNKGAKRLYCYFFQLLLLAVVECTYHTPSLEHILNNTPLDGRLESLGVAWSAVAKPPFRPWG
jgi:hypothetical protein